jgi:myo-inositol-1(or 4)-monophosphatase
MTEISATELSDIYKFAIQLGKDAGRILLDGLERRRSGQDAPEDPVEKLNAVDIVTQTDNGMYDFLAP